MTIPTVVNIPDTVHGSGFVNFTGLNSAGWIVSNYEVRQELAEFQPGDADLYGFSPLLLPDIQRGFYKKRRTTEVFSFTGKFRKSTIDQFELRALADPSLGILTMTVENLTYTGFLDSLTMAYNYQGDYVEITISLYYQWRWLPVQCI